MISREEATDMVAAHAEGLHADTPREFCPDCEGRELSSYPTHDEIQAAKWREQPQNFLKAQATEHAAWGAVMQELRKRGVGSVNKGGKDETLHDAICAWAEELVQLRLSDPDPTHATKALKERREKYLGVE
jgi:hypothetical protein